MSNENERELTDEELEMVLGGVCIGDVNIANLTNSLNGNTVQVYAPISVKPQVPVNAGNVSPVSV